jgi:hypothetical protein
MWSVRRVSKAKEQGDRGVAPLDFGRESLCERRRSTKAICVQGAFPTRLHS